MTVSELISKLKDYNPDALVITTSSDCLGEETGTINDVSGLPSDDKCMWERWKYPQDVSPKDAKCVFIGYFYDKDEW